MTDHMHFASLVDRWKPSRFVQVGSFDGVTDNALLPYIRKHKWTGIAIEPVADAYARLCKNLKATCLNVAIHPTQNEGTLWVDAKKPALSSFVREVNFVPKLPTRRIEVAALQQITVPCKTLTSIFETAGKIDLLDIDVVAFDFEVIRSLDLKMFRPKIIRYSHRWIDKHEPVRYLSRFDYKCLTDRNYTVAWRD